MRNGLLRMRANEKPSTENTRSPSALLRYVLLIRCWRRLTYYYLLLRTSCESIYFVTTSLYFYAITQLQIGRCLVTISCLSSTFFDILVFYYTTKLLLRILITNLRKQLYKTLQLIGFWSFVAFFEVLSYIFCWWRNLRLDYLSIILQRCFLVKSIRIKMKKPTDVILRRHWRVLNAAKCSDGSMNW